MSKGRTGFEILKSFFSGPPKPVEEQFFNPLQAKIESQARINRDDFDELWRVTEIWAWDRKINGNSHPFADYILVSESKQVVLRVLPKVVKGKQADPDILLLQQYWPDNLTGPYPWGEESPYVLDGLMDKTGEFVRWAGEPNEERYFRDICNVPVTVSIIKDQNHDGKVEMEEVQRHEFSTWTFRRTTTDIANQEFEQYLMVQLSGVYDPRTKRVSGGDKDILILRGEGISANNFMLY